MADMTQKERLEKWEAADPQYRAAYCIRSAGVWDVCLTLDTPEAVREYSAKDADFDAAVAAALAQAE
jgi:hypothetical protein